MLESVKNRVSITLHYCWYYCCCCYYYYK